MAINKNHEFEDLNGIKCAIVEKNALSERVEFIKELLTGNGYTVIVTPSAPPKPAPTPPSLPVGDTPTESVAAPAPPPLPPVTFTIGVTDVSFNPVNAIFGRLLKTRDGHIVTLAYWQQKETVSHDEVPYFERKFDEGIN